MLDPHGHCKFKKWHKMNHASCIVCYTYYGGGRPSKLHGGFDFVTYRVLGIKNAPSKVYIG
jgi:hypothetical protein